VTLPPANAGGGIVTTGEAPTELIAEVDGRRFEIRLHGASAVRSTTATSTRRPEPPRGADAHGATGDGNLLRSPIQGTVVRVSVEPGDQVKRGETVCVVEAMKMENDVTAHRDGAVISIAAAPGSAVRVGDPVAEIA
jgi:acetyl-CoA/propionyl-CoA carboxylase biotin carboxyl carrier protein